MKVALLSAPGLLPNAEQPHRIAHLFAHQREALTNACARREIDIIPVDWREFECCADYSAVLPLGAWNYQDDAAGFLSALNQFDAAGVPAFNSTQIVRWNLHKTYLQQLSKSGVATIPTLWVDAPTALDVKRAFDEFDTDTVILKRQIGAGAQGQERIARGTEIPGGVLLDRPGMIQPLMKAIETEGEWSFIFIDGVLSHVALKQAAAGEYRIQPTYGGTTIAVEPTAHDRERAEGVLEFVKSPLLYARVDMVRGSDGDLRLMELELIEPFLYPPTDASSLAEAFATALEKRLT